MSLPAGAESPLDRLHGVGIGLRTAHYHAFLECRAPVDFLEVHTENYFDHGSGASRMLDRIRCHYPISLHGVGLCIGSVDGYFEQHLRQIAELVQRVQPMLISEHLCWGAVAGRHFNDLLPLALTDEALSLVCDRVEQIQQRLGRQLLLENVSTFLRFRQDRFSEIDFLSRVAMRTSCSVLLDMNNLYVNECNHGEDSTVAIGHLPTHMIGEIHLGGHLVTPDAVVDHHGDRVAEPVWALYRVALRRFGPVPTLIEWDTDLPDVDLLFDEVRLARACQDAVCGVNWSAPGRANPGAELRTISVAADATGSAADRSTPMPGAGTSADRSHDNAIALSAMQALVGRALVDGRRHMSAALPLFAGTPETIAQRLALYRGNLVATWETVLAAAYPVMHALVGKAFFLGLVRAYGKQHPSTSGDVHAFGVHFARFLAGFARVAQYPYFGDMARLEWMLHRADTSPPGEALDARTLSQWTPQQVEDARLGLCMHDSLFASRWAVVSVWHAHQENPVGTMPARIEEGEWAIIARAGWRPTVLPLSQAAFACLSAIDGGMRVGEALDAALAIDPELDFAAELTRWLQHQVLCVID